MRILKIVIFLCVGYFIFPGELLAQPRLVLNLPHFSTIFNLNQRKTILFRIEDLPATTNLKSVEIKLINEYSSEEIDKSNSSLKYPTKDFCFFRYFFDTSKLPGAGIYILEVVAFDSSRNKRISIKSDINFLVLPSNSSNSGAGYIGISDIWGLGGVSLPFDSNIARLLQQCNISDIRVFVGWDKVKSPKNLSFVFNRMDQVVQACEEFNLKVIPVLAYSPPFALSSKQRRNGVKGPPDNNLWRQFVSKFSIRYATSISEYEIWNEPNVKIFWGGTIAQYLELVKIAKTEIEKHRKDATIISGGLSGVSSRWAASLMSDTANIDIFAVHPYRFVKSFLERANPNIQSLGYGRNSFIDDLTGLNSIAHKNGFTGDLYITEIGFNTLQKPNLPKLFSPAVDYDTQASLIARSAILSKSQGVKKYFNWQFADTYGLGTGIITNAKKGFMPKPSLGVISFLNSIIKENTTIKMIRNDSIFEYEIDNNGIKYLAVWSPYSKVTYNTTLGYYYDYYGCKHLLKKNDSGVATVDIDYRPIFITREKNL